MEGQIVIMKNDFVHAVFDWRGFFLSKKFRLSPELVNIVFFLSSHDFITTINTSVFMVQLKGQ